MGERRKAGGISNRVGYRDRSDECYQNHSACGVIEGDVDNDLSIVAISRSSSQAEEVHNLSGRS